MLVGPRVMTVLLGAFAIVSLLLTAVGLYGTLSYSVAQRGREIGIRLALGAVPADVVRLVVRQGMLPAVLGLLLGIPAALGAGQALGALLIGVSPADPLTFAAVVLFLCAVALAASWAPARRAAQTDPGIALRAE
jgi:putative ABC transport system permease protein